MPSKRLLLLSFILGLGSLVCVHAAHAGNVAPTITGSPRATVTAGRWYSFTPTASDANGDKLTFGVAGLPPWAAFSRRTGQLYGRPGAADVGKSRLITIAVADGRAEPGHWRTCRIAVAPRRAPMQPPRFRVRRRRPQRRRASIRSNRWRPTPKARC